LTGSQDLIIRPSEKYDHDWERKNMPFLYFTACS